MRISDWSSDVCSSDLPRHRRAPHVPAGQHAPGLGRDQRAPRPAQNWRRHRTVPGGRADLCGREADHRVCEAYVPFGNSPEESPALLFGARFGLSTVHQEDHLVLDLPVADECLADLDAAHVASEDYDVVMWGERCPDEHVEAFCEMRTQMARDVPSGEIDYLPHVVDETRLRTDEDRVAAGWISIVAAARRRVDGVMGGYSMLVLPRGGDRKST